MIFYLQLCSPTTIPCTVAPGFAPALVDNEQAFEIRQRMIDDIKEPSAPKFKVGDHVRLVKIKLTIEKGYKTNFTDEIHKISDAQLHGSHYQYKVVDMANAQTLKTFEIKE